MPSRQQTVLQILQINLVIKILSAYSSWCSRRIERAEPFELVARKYAHVVPTATHESDVVSSRWFGLLAHAVYEPGWSLPSLVGEVGVVDRPVPPRDVRQHVAPARLVWAPLVAAVALVGPVIGEVIGSDLPLATGRRAVRCLDAAALVCLGVGLAGWPVL